VQFGSFDFLCKHDGFVGLVALDDPSGQRKPGETAEAGEQSYGEQCQGEEGPW
jgi:hypothetical protein